MSCQFNNPDELKTIMDEYGGQKIGRPIIDFTQKTNAFIRMIHPNVVEWYDVENVPVDKYRIVVYYDETIVKDQYVTACHYDLAPLWDRIPEGYFFVCVFAENKDKELVAVSFVRSLYKASDFIKTKLKPKVPMDEAAKKALSWLLHYKPDMSIPHNRETVFAPDEPVSTNHFAVGLGDAKIEGRQYPAQYILLWTQTLLKANKRYKKTDPVFAKECMDLAESFASKMSERATFPAGYAYEYLVHHWSEKGEETTLEQEQWAHNWKGERVENLCAPTFGGMAGSAYIMLYRETGKECYKEAFTRIAETLKRTQKDDGSWPYYVNAKSGEEYYAYTSVNSMVAVFFDEIVRFFPDMAGSYKDTRDKVWKWVLENPVRTMRWENQFADVNPMGPYQNIGGFDAWWFAQYILDAHGDDPAMVDTVEALLRNLENSFVFFKPDQFIAPLHGNFADFLCPTVGEQNAWPFVMAWNTAEWARLCFRLWKATGKEIYQERAKAGAAAISYNLSDEGFILTYTIDKITGQCGHPRDEIWFGDSLPSILAWMELSEL